MEAVMGLESTHTDAVAEAARILGSVRTGRKSQSSRENIAIARAALASKREREIAEAAAEQNEQRAGQIPAEG